MVFRTSLLFEYSFLRWRNTMSLLLRSPSSLPGSLTATYEDVGLLYPITGSELGLHSSWHTIWIDVGIWSRWTQSLRLLDDFTIRLPWWYPCGSSFINCTSASCSLLVCSWAWAPWSLSKLYSDRSSGLSWQQALKILCSSILAIATKSWDWTMKYRALYSPR